MSKKEQKRKEGQQKRLAWVLREYDCHNLDQAKQEAASDQTLHRLLRECGVDMASCQITNKLYNNTPRRLS